MVACRVGFFPRHARIGRLGGWVSFHRRHRHIRVNGREMAIANIIGAQAGLWAEISLLGRGIERRAYLSDDRRIREATIHGGLRAHDIKRAGRRCRDLVRRNDRHIRRIARQLALRGIAP